jgi:uncharacterized DUF497 family protein
MEFEWDPDKATSNRAKHGVSFELAMRVWDDPLREEAEDRIIDGEMRWRTFGVVEGFLLLIVVNTQPDETRVRIISARRATPQERRRYEQQTL